MGGLIATRCALRRTDLAGLVVSGAAYKVETELSGLQRRISALLARAAARSAAVAVWQAGHPLPRSRGGPPLRRRSADASRQGPGGHGVRDVRAGEDTRARASSLTLPMLVMHGTDDKLTDPAGSIAVYSAASAPTRP